MENEYRVTWQRKGGSQLVEAYTQRLKAHGTALVYSLTMNTIVFLIMIRMNLFTAAGNEKNAVARVRHIESDMKD